MRFATCFAKVGDRRCDVCAPIRVKNVDACAQYDRCPSLVRFRVEVAELLPFSMYRAFFSDPAEVCYPISEIF